MAKLCIIIIILLPVEVYQAGRGTVGRHYNTTHPEIEKHYYTCKICTEYPPTASLVKIIEHFRKVSDFQKSVQEQYLLARISQEFCLRFNQGC